jgi:hypothetical protein
VAQQSNGKQGKGAIKWTRLSCRSFAANAVRLQLHVPADNLGNFMRTLVMPKARGVVANQPAREADQERRHDRQPRLLRHIPNGRGRGVTADLAEILSLIARLRAPPAPA